MAVALRSLPSTLLALKGQFSNDPNLIDRLHIDLLISKSKEVWTVYRSVFETQGNAVIEKRQELIRLFSPLNIAINDFQKSLGEFKAHILSAVEGMKVLEHKVHVVIEECNNKKSQQEREIKREEKNILEISRSIVSLERKINEHESTARSKDAEAERYSKNAAKEEEKRKEAEIAGVVGLAAGATVGILLAPFSGGASLLATGAGFGTLGTTFIYAKDLRDKAERYRGYARDECEAAEKARDNIKDLNSKKISSRANINQSQITVWMLQTSTENLVKVRQCLLSSIELMNNVEHHVQDLISSTFGAIQHGSNFEIIQQALSEDPEGLEGVAYDLMMELREKWALVESGIRSVIQSV